MRSELLEQTRLDVSEKSRSNIFNWRGQFTPQFIEYLLDALAVPGSLVIDPFCGSGTVLLEAAAKGFPAAGYEINPAAYAMSRFIAFANTPTNERSELFKRVSNQVHRLIGPFRGLPLFAGSEDNRERCINLLDLARELFAATELKSELLLALIVMMRAETAGGGELASVICKACSSVAEDLTSLPFSQREIVVHLRDARDISNRYNSVADLVLTSPPYINVFNYHQNHRALLEALGFDLLKVAESEIGSNRKNRANRFRTVVQYALDMELCLASLGLALKPGANLVMVVGHESNVRGVPFSNSAIIRELAGSLGCFQLEGERHRVFTNRFGKAIREDILVMASTGRAPVQGAGRLIAQRHLEDALRRASGKPRDDITAALSDASTISASPILSRKEII